jgi:hypothetical protein
MANLQNKENASPLAYAQQFQAQQQSQFYKTPQKESFCEDYQQVLDFQEDQREDMMGSQSQQVVENR